MKRWGFVWLCLVTCQTISASSAQSTQENHVSQYALKQQRIGDSQTALRLINRTTRQTVWKKQVADLDCVGWSQDHKALALSIYTGDRTPFRLLIWREGKPVRLIDDSPMPVKYGGGFIDGVIDLVWSPDSRRVLFRVYQSGGKTMNNGLLYCLDTKDWCLSSAPDEVRQMRWLGPNQVRYQAVRYVAQGKNNHVIEEKYFRSWTIK